MKKVFIIIPAYNESKHIINVLKKVKSQGYKNIVVVDDGSKDDTYKKVLSEKITILRHIINLGKGAALKTGCEYAIQNGADIIVVMDSDGQHKAEDISRFLNALKNVDVIFGSRELNESMPFILRFGNNFINFMVKLLYGITLKDTQSGFRAFKSDVYNKIRWESTNYSVESEMIANIGKNKLKYKEIMIETIYNDKYKGTTVLDGFKIVLNMIKWRIYK